MALDGNVQKELENALGNPYLAQNLVSTINAAAGAAGVVSIAGLTGVITASAARTGLGLVIGTNVQAHASQLDTQVAAAPVTVTGSKGSNAALTSLMAALVSLGLVTDSTS